MHTSKIIDIDAIGESYNLRACFSMIFLCDYIFKLKMFVNFFSCLVCGLNGIAVCDNCGDCHVYDEACCEMPDPRNENMTVCSCFSTRGLFASVPRCQSMYIPMNLRIKWYKLRIRCQPSFVKKLKVRNRKKNLLVEQRQVERMA